MKGYIKILYIGVLIVMVCLLTGCFKKKIRVENLKSFHYSYSVGYYMNASYSYDIEKKDDKYIVSIKDAGMPEEKARKYTVEKGKIQQFESLLNEIEIYRWNGFQKSDKNVLDGNSFSLSIWLENKENISASGYMMWPSHYTEKKAVIENWFFKIDKNRPKDID
jgi:hypothetical protein